MDSDTHSIGVGRILSHLLNLELILRFCIAIKTEHSTVIPKLEALKKEKIHKRTAIIDCNTLANVIQKFNCEFKDFNMSVEKSKVVHLRNALVHAKIMSKKPFPNPMTIFNLDKVDRDTVKVVFFEEMTEDWFESNRKFLKNETLRICDFYDRLEADFIKSLREKKRERV